MTFDLSCIYDSRQNFYGKARVEVVSNNNVVDYRLYSYGTLVGKKTQVYGTGVITYNYFGKYSQTTTRHQKEFFRQCGLTWDEIDKLFKEGSLIKEVK
jgi:hypothetical protein